MDDLINKQEAVDILELGAEILRRVLNDMDVVGIDREKYSYGLKLIESDIEDIKELPPAQYERKTGRWITDDSELEIKCNKCGKSFSDYVNAGTEYIFLEEIPNFCPNCGADMRGEEHEIN